MKIRPLFARPVSSDSPVQPDDPGITGDLLEDRLAILTQTHPPRNDDTRTPSRTVSRRFSLPAAALVVMLLVLTLLLAAWRGWLSPEPDLARGLALFNEGDNVRAIHTFARMLRDRETDLAARYHLGAAYHNYGWHDEALDQYVKTLRLAMAYSTRAAHSAARIHAVRGEWEQSLELFNLALQFDPQSPEIRAERDALLTALQQTEAVATPAVPHESDFVP